MCQAFGSPEIKLVGWPGNFVLKPPLLRFQPTVICLPTYGNALGKLTLIGAVTVQLPELDGPLALPELGGPGFEFSLSVG